ncbi:hypothetical protein V2H45_24550 [Tumidithrix elongata RA019]|uniref:Lipoprotein n=1 Tax=Tumidithrix elongata BACA0141 TaxID=2716417 RepID=A0AAW9PY39_9CYAN|nr:hypothetical protein [Tumidithrix elongata RA019]
MRLTIRSILYLSCLVGTCIPFSGCEAPKSWTLDQISSSVQVFQKELVNVNHPPNVSTTLQKKEAEVLAVSIRPKFRKYIDELRKRTSVPIVLPSVVPGDLDINHLKPNLTVQIESATVSKYELVLCLDESRVACRYTYFTGEEITPATKTALQRYEELHQLANPKFKPYRSPEKANNVMLARDIEGFFIPFIGGASASNSYMVWDQNGYRYSIGIKAGRLEELKKFANSAIENQKVQ